MCVLEFWKGVETKTAEKEATPELSKGTVNREKKKSKEELWSTSLSDDSWYRAPQFHPEVLLMTIILLNQGKPQLYPTINYRVSQKDCPLIFC